ncbi:MAG: hypothetical protein ACKESC_00530 [Candidatus Hodgkinia cicadicola]
MIPEMNLVEDIVLIQYTFGSFIISWSCPGPNTFEILACNIIIK